MFQLLQESKKLQKKHSIEFLATLCALLSKEEK